MNDAVNGKWTLDNGELLNDRTCYARVEFPYTPPDEYDFQASFTVLEPRDQIAMVCAHNGVQFMWKFGAHGNRVTALDQEGGQVEGSQAQMAPFEARAPLRPLPSARAQKPRSRPISTGSS